MSLVCRETKTEPIRSAEIHLIAGARNLRYWTSRTINPPSGGVGTICNSCAESHVTPILAGCGIATEMIARQYPYEWRHPRGFPPNHAYNLIDIGSSRFVLDLDATANTRVVVAPIEANVPFYDVGFDYHKRSFAPTGEILLHALWRRTRAARV